MDGTPSMKNLIPVFLGLLAMILITGCSRSSKNVSNTSSESVSENTISTEEASRPRWVDPVSSEQHWIVDAICREIAGIATLAKSGQGPLPILLVSEQRHKRRATGIYQCTVGSDNTPPIEIRVENFVWSPTAYSQLARVLLERGGLHPPEKEPAQDITALVALTDLQAGVIEKENQRVSAWLGREPLNPSAHEEAALILGGFALRECAGSFEDVRWCLSRMTAHLALATALRGDGKLSDPGQVADLIIRTLANRQAEAAVLIEELRKGREEDPRLMPWIRTLHLRTTSDWRTLQQPESATLLERLAYVHALVTSLDPNAAMDFFEKKTPESIADWGRMILAAGYSVECGHIFTRSGLAAELQEINLIRGDLSKNNLNANFLADALNLFPEPSVRQTGGALSFSVIDRGMWAQFAQRHLCHEMFEADDFMRHRWGVAEAADNYEKQVDQLFSKLTLYPLLKVRRARAPAVYLEAVNQGITLLKDHPELVTPGYWLWFTSNKPSFPKVPLGTRNENDWFFPMMLSGTVYDVDRVQFFGTLRDSSDEQYKIWAKMAPWNHQLHRIYFGRKSAPKPDPDRVMEMAGPVLEFNERAVRLMARASAGNPDEYIRWMTKAAELDPGSYWELATCLVEQGRTEDAVKAYESGVEKCRDSVAMANSVFWLVNHYYEQKQYDKANKVADMAAEVYSHRGLETKAYLMERLERFGEAEEILLKIQERYGDHDLLLGFYHRYTGKYGLEKYGSAYERYLKAIFPEGIRKVSLTDFKDPPVDGVLIVEDGNRLRKAGLSVNDVIVAIDGIQVHDFRQYEVVRGWSYDPVMRLIVWQKVKYAEVEVRLQNRRFGVEMVPYREASPSAGRK